MYMLLLYMSWGNMYMHMHMLLYMLLYVHVQICACPLGKHVHIPCMSWGNMCIYRVGIQNAPAAAPLSWVQNADRSHILGKNNNHIKNKTT